MSIIQVLRILIARSWIIGLATISCVLGAIAIVLILPTSWEAHSRVMLNLMKPDPLTGQMIQGDSSRGYVATQIELIKDYRVAGQIADQLGLLSDPRLISEYQARPKSDQRDFRRWIAQRIIDRTQVALVSGSNVLEITYRGTTPQDAKLIADGLMKAYIDTTLSFRRSEAAKNAEWFEGQAQKAKAALDEADAARVAYQKANNVILADDKTDLDTARLRAMSGAAPSMAPVINTGVIGPSPSSLALGQLDAQIAQESQSLGPNHPTLIDLKARRAALASQVAQERAAARSAASASAASAGAGVGALESSIARQRARVVAQGDKIEKLRQLQQEVDMRRDQFTKTANKAAEFRQESLIGDAGLSVLGQAVTPQSPAFPNKPLIVGGSLFFGLGLGVLVALLMELFARRVRGIEDLRSIVDTPVLGVIPAIEGKKSRARRNAKPSMAGRFRGQPKPGSDPDGPTLPGAVAA
jgi:uncharacterized protein involved in exopolysaccharide biosynthesis